MSFGKIRRDLREHGMKPTASKVAKIGRGYFRSIKGWSVRRCRCCGKMTVFLANGTGSEAVCCLFCGANLRYELLRECIKDLPGDLTEKEILELDPHSPLRPFLSVARNYHPSFYLDDCESGFVRADGAQREDIQSLSFEDASLDLIVSSDVLEHVPDLHKAFAETARVLKLGGMHLFTVPPREVTRRRAEIIDGAIKHYETPEYHGDPLSPKGILAFWDVGGDLPIVMSECKLRFSIMAGPEGPDNRIVWCAMKI
jgi:SAM-dependent methyltransferase